MLNLSEEDKKYLENIDKEITAIDKVTVEFKKASEQIYIEIDKLDVNDIDYFEKLTNIMNKINANNKKLFSH